MSCCRSGGPQPRAQPHDVRDGQRRVFSPATVSHGGHRAVKLVLPDSGHPPGADSRSWAAPPAAGGTARHDAVLPGLARAADARGLHHPGLRGHRLRYSRPRVQGVRTIRGIDPAPEDRHRRSRAQLGPVRHGRRAPASAEPSAAERRGVRTDHDASTPWGDVERGARACEPSDKGELVLGAGIDAFNSYAQRGSFHVIESQMAALELFPLFSRLRDAHLGRHRGREPRRLIGPRRCGGPVSQRRGKPAASGHPGVGPRSSPGPRRDRAHLSPLRSASVTTEARSSTSTAPPRWRIEHPFP